MSKEIPVPDELKILLPDLSKGVILVGSKAYEIFPLNEGQLERITSEIAEVMEKIACPDGKCPKCEKIIKGALPRKIFKCPDDGEDLLTMNQSPVEAIITSSKVPKWVEMITGIPEEEVKANITLVQIKHFAALFWKQNFSDDGMPEESKENFAKLLKIMGPMEKKEASSAETREPAK
jgi:hypothetical protein